MGEIKICKGRSWHENNSDKKGEGGIELGLGPMPLQNGEQPTLTSSILGTNNLGKTTHATG